MLDEELEVYFGGMSALFVRYLISRTHLQSLFAQSGRHRAIPDHTDPRSTFGRQLPSMQEEMALLWWLREQWLASPGQML